MPRISNIALDQNVEKGDKLLGSDAGGATKNYSIDDITIFLKDTNGIGIVGQIPYVLHNSSFGGSATRQKGSLTISSSLTTFAFSSITTLKASKFPNKNDKSVVNVLSAFAGKEVIIASNENQDNFGIYSCTAVTQDNTETDFYDLTLSFLSGNGNLVVDKFYSITLRARAQDQTVTLSGDVTGSGTTSITTTIANSAVETTMINDLAITTAKLGDGSVTVDKIDDGNVNTAKLQDGAVTTIKINDGAVTNDKLAGSIANSKLSNSSVTIGNSTIALGGTDTTLTGLTDIDLTAGAKTIFDGVGSNNLTIGASGTTIVMPGALTVDGNVGIGTTSPSTKFHLEGGIARFDNASSNYLEIDGSNSGTNNAVISSRFNQIQLQTNTGAGDPHIALLPATGGNVGIGTTSPSQKLTVEGNIELGTGGYIYGDTVTPYLRLSNGAGSILGYSNGYINVGPSFVYVNNSGEQFRISSANGRVGIGTTSPDAKLHVFTPGYPQMALESNGGIWQIGVGTGNDLGFRKGASGDYQLWLDSSDNVGIGTTSPGEKLEVNGNILVNKGTANRTTKLEDDGLYISRTSDGNYSSQIKAGSNSNHLDIKARSNISLINNSSTVLITNDSGNVGIGTTSPSKKLEVSGNGTVLSAVGSGNAGISILSNGTDELSYIYFADTADSDVGGLIYDHSINGFTVRTGGNNRHFIGSNVGIGTTSPSNRLQVTDGSIGIDSQYAIRDNRNNTILQQSADTLPSNRTLTIGNATYSNVIIPNGNVGIGTTSPSQKLEVSNNIKAQGYLLAQSYRLNDYSTYNILSNSGTTVNLEAPTSNGSFSIQPGASGITSITYGASSLNGARNILNLSRTYEASNGSGTAYGVNLDVILNETGGSKSYVGYFANYTETAFLGSTGNLIQLQRDSVDRFLVDRNGKAYFSGNVGIGTTSPSEKLEVDGNIKADNLVLSAHGTELSETSTRTIIAASDSRLDILNIAKNTFVTSFDRNTGLHVFHGTNSVTINANTGTISKNNAFLDLYNSGTGNVRLFNQSTNVNFGSIIFGTSDTERMRIDSSGNVGIGTTSPSEKLEVNGKIKAVDVNFSGLSAFSSNANAIAGGLSTGDLYQDGTGVLRIVI